MGNVTGFLPKGRYRMLNFLRRLPRSSLSLLYDEARLPKIIRRSLNLILMGNIFGGLFGIICGGGTTAMIGLANELKAGDLAFGVINGIPQVAALLQIPFSILVSRTQQRKKYMLTIGLLSRALWLFFGFIPLVIPANPEGLRLYTLIFLVGLTSCGGSMINVCWLPWFSDLAPIEIRGRWFSIRDMINAVVSLVFSIVVARLLDTLPPYNRYIIIFLIGGTLGMLDMICFGFCHEKYGSAPHKLRFFGVMRDVMKNRPFVRLVVMWTAWCFASNLCAPYLSRYSVNEMGLTFTQMMIFGTVASSVATVLVMTRWGRAMNQFGCRSVMLVSTLATSFTDIFYVFSTPGNIWPVLLRNFMGAMFWSGSNLAANSMQLSTAAEDAKPSYIAIFACVTSLVGVALGTMAGGFALDKMEGVRIMNGLMDRYQVMIIVSVILRLLVAILLVRPLENDRDGTPAQLVSSLIHGHAKLFRRGR